MEEIVDADDGTGGTRPANNQEHGGQIREVYDDDGNPTGVLEVIPSDSSPVKSPIAGQTIAITHKIDIRTRATFHGHSSGTKDGIIYVQTPSTGDFSSATDARGNPYNNYQFGMSKTISGGQKVYVHSTNGVKAVINKSAWSKKYSGE